MIVKINHCSHMPLEQRRLVMALFMSLPIGCTRTSDLMLPSGHFSFSIEGPQIEMAEVRQRLVEIVGFEQPGLREYTLQEAYNVFGYRTYTDVWYKSDSPTSLNNRDGFEVDCLIKGMHAIIYGMSISSGQIFAKVQLSMEHDYCAYVSLHDLARDFEWPNGKPCGIIVPSKSVQKRLDATGHKYRVGFD